MLILMVRYLCLKDEKNYYKEGIGHLSVFSQGKTEWAEITGKEIWVDLLNIFQRRRIIRHQDSCLEKWSGLH